MISLKFLIYHLFTLGWAGSPSPARAQHLNAVISGLCLALAASGWVILRFSPPRDNISCHTCLILDKKQVHLELKLASEGLVPTVLIWRGGSRQ